MGYTSRFFAEPEVWMPWKESSVMEERLRFVARLLDGELMTDVCREFGISRKTGYKIFNRYREHGCEAFGDRSRRPVRYATQLPQQGESLIVTLKREKPHWGARKIRELLLRRLASDVRVPAKSTIHAVLDRHGLVKRMGKRRPPASGTPLSQLKIPLILDEAVNIDEEGLLTHEFDELLHERPQSRLRHSWHQLVVQAALPEQGVDAPFGGAGFEMFVEAQRFASGAKQRQKRNRQCIEKP